MVHYTIIDFCWGGHEVLLNSKLYIDWREAEVSTICLLFKNFMFTETKVNNCFII